MNKFQHRPQITKDPPDLPLTPAQERVIQKYFIDEGVPCHVTPYKDDEVFIEIGRGHPDHEPSNGHYLTSDGCYVLPDMQGRPNKINPDSL